MLGVTRSATPFRNDRSPLPDSRKILAEPVHVAKIHPVSAEIFHRTADVTSHVPTAGIRTLCRVPQNRARCGSRGTFAVLLDMSAAHRISNSGPCVLRFQHPTPSLLPAAAIAMTCQVADPATAAGMAGSGAWKPLYIGQECWVTCRTAIRTGPPVLMTAGFVGWSLSNRLSWQLQRLP